MRLKLLLICWGDPFTAARARAAGTEIFVRSLAIELVKQGHDVHIVHGGKNHSRSETKHLTIHSFQSINIPYVRMLDFRRKCARLCTELVSMLEIDAMISCGSGTFSSYTFNRIKKLKRKPLLVYYAMDSMKMEYERSKLSTDSRKISTSFDRWIRYTTLIKSDRESCIHSDLILASSRDTASHLVADYNVPPNKIMVLYEGVPDDFAEGIEVIDPSKPIFIHVAGGPRKGTTYFLEAMKLLEEKYALRTKAIITRATSTHIEQAKKLGINIKAHKYLPYPELKRLYASSTALVSPSLSEGFGLPIVETAMLGKLAIVSNIGSLPELVVDGENGFIVPVADIITLAERMYQIAVNEQLRKRMGEKAKQFSQRFRISYTAKMLIELLDNRLGCKGDVQ